MRAFLVLAAILLGAFLLVDQFTYDGRYRQAAWREARHQGQQFSNQIGDWFRRAGLR